MKKAMTTGTLMVAALVCAGPLLAHHSGSMYQKTPVWVKGTVVSFERINPHTILTLEDRTADGQVRQWRIEGPQQSRFDNRVDGLVPPQIGDAVEFCAFAYKTADELSRMYPDADFSARRIAEEGGSQPPQQVAGHVMVKSDGEMQFWEPHGVLAECIRSPNYPREAWLEFLNTSPAARQAWCEQRTYALVQSNESLLGFVEEINGRIDNPCP
jgi:Family of unknown function (DUF6152)